MESVERAEPRVAVIMGSDSDWSMMQGAGQALEEFGVPWEARVVSAHRTPENMVQYARAAAKPWDYVIVAEAGGAAHLQGMVASLTPLPVIGVPVAITKLDPHGRAAVDRADARGRARCDRRGGRRAQRGAARVRILGRPISAHRPRVFRLRDDRWVALARWAASPKRHRRAAIRARRRRLAALHGR